MPPTLQKRSAIQLTIDLRLSYAVIATGLILLGFFWNNLQGFNLQYVILIVGIFFANVFMFVVNDYYDAPHDSKDAVKKKRNLFCSPDTNSLGRMVLYASLLLSLLLGALVSLPIFIIIVLFDVLAYAYSAPPIKLRNRLYWDWIFVFLWKGFVITASYIYFFGTHLSLTPFMYGTLTIILLSSLINQMDNQIRDFKVDRINNSGHSVQRLGHETSSLVKTTLLTIFFAFSIVFCYFLGLYITLAVILVNISLYFIVNPRKYTEVLEFTNIWIVILFLEHFRALFSFQQQILFSLWILAMIAIAIIHVKRQNLFEDRRTFQLKLLPEET